MMDEGLTTSYLKIVIQDLLAGGQKKNIRGWGEGEEAY
jgi:hypothetical protein